MRKRLVIEQLSQSKDTAGQDQETWTEVLTVWGRLQPASGLEIEIGNQLQARITHSISIRHPGFVVAPQRHRFRLGTRTFNVTQAVNVEERNRDWWISAVEDLVPGQS